MDRERDAGNRRVLVVDDELEVRKSYRVALESTRRERRLSRLAALDGDGATTAAEEGYELVEASQGEEAIERVREAFAAGERFAVAFIDMRMPPGMDGLETAKGLRAIDDKIYVVFVTAHSDKSVDEMDREMGHDTLLLKKPFMTDEVFQLARSLCKGWDKDRLLEASVSRSDLESAYHSGVSEMSSHLIHNVGNIVSGIGFYLQRLTHAGNSLSAIVKSVRTQQHSVQDRQSQEMMARTADGLEQFSEQFFGGKLEQAEMAITSMIEIMDAQKSFVQSGDPFTDSRFRLKEGVDRAVTIIAGRLEKSAVTLECVVDKRLGSVVLPKNPFQQMVVNLLKNAVESVDERGLQESGPNAGLDAGDLERWIRLQVTPVDEGCFELLCEDSGSGFESDEQISRVFENGYTTKKYGSGQGLSSLKSFVDQVGGEVAVTNGEIGARFVIRLPVCREEKG